MNTDNTNNTKRDLSQQGEDNCIKNMQTHRLESTFSHLFLKARVFIDVSRFYRRVSASVGGKKLLLKHLCLSVFIYGFVTAEAQIQMAEPDLPPPELAQRLKKLESELRCLVCQNQTLAESPAGLAGDLRREVRLLIDHGKTDDEIKAYLKARYGDFVLYRPPVDGKTYLLWFAPFFLLGGGGILMWWMARRRALVVSPPLPPSDAAGGDDATRRARKLLNNDPDPK